MDIIGYLDISFFLYKKVGEKAEGQRIRGSKERDSERITYARIERVCDEEICRPSVISSPGRDVSQACP